MLKATRALVLAIAMVFTASLSLAVEFPAEAIPTRLAFGSCSKESKAQPIWQAVLADAPQAFIFLGDNIYADTENPQVLLDKYQKLAAIPGFKHLREQVPVFATWDDHDYGQDDAGAENPIKRESRKAMLEFWGVPTQSPRYSQEGGIYTSHYFGDEAHRVQLLLLDLRWNRSPLEKVGLFKRAGREVKNMGPYLRHEDASTVFLGEAQWQWLEAELRKPAKVRIIGSSLQLLADFTGWEAWANFPHEQQRLFKLIQSTSAEGVFVISGDTHWSELSLREDGPPYPLYDLTSSGLTEEWKRISPNDYRVSEAYAEANYGLIDIDWSKPPFALHLSIKNAEGETLIEKHIHGGQLRMPGGDVPAS